RAALPCDEGDQRHCFVKRCARDACCFWRRAGHRPARMGGADHRRRACAPLARAACAPAKRIVRAPWWTWRAAGLTFSKANASEPRDAPEISPSGAAGRFLAPWIAREQDVRTSQSSDRLPMPPTVLVTGASGFLGRHVVPALQARGFT